MACNNCDSCFLIDVECLRQYTGLDGFTYEDLRAEIDQANYELSKLLECDLCENKDSETFNQAVYAKIEFKRYYSWLIYLFYAEMQGSSKSSKEGFIVKTGDDFSNFARASSGAIQNKINFIRERVGNYESDFLEYMKDTYADCFADDDYNCDCGTCDKCTCQSDYSTLDIMPL